MHAILITGTFSEETRRRRLNQQLATYQILRMTIADNSKTVHISIINGCTVLQYLVTDYRTFIKETKRRIICVKRSTPILTKKVQDPPLPRPFELPQNFPQAITIALLNKKLIVKPTAKFIITISQAVYSGKIYLQPTLQSSTLMK